MDFGFFATFAEKYVKYHCTYGHQKSRISDEQHSL